MQEKSISYFRQLMYNGGEEVKVNYVDDKGGEHEFLIDDSKVVSVDFYTNDEDGATIKFLLVSGKTMTLYLGFINVETWKQLRDHFRERFI